MFLSIALAIICWLNLSYWWTHSQTNDYYYEDRKNGMWAVIFFVLFLASL